MVKERKSDTLAVFVVGVEGGVRMGSSGSFKEFADLETGVLELPCPSW